MERLCHTFELTVGSEAEYDQMHAEIWPELAAGSVDAGYRNYTLFRRGTQVVCVCECHPDKATTQRMMAEQHQDVVDRWNRAMEPLIARMVDDEGQLFEYDECWHLGGDQS